MKGLSTTLLLALAALLATGCSEDEPTRLESRSSISGRVQLADVAGLDDLSRVRVDLGRGEGGIAPAEDGSFAFSDLESDVYALSITYAGSLTADSDRSAYQPFEQVVVAPAGSTQDLGTLEPQLGFGRIEGDVALPEATDPVLLTAQLLVDGEERYARALSAPGRYLFEPVRVGVYTLRVSGPGFATHEEEVTVGHDGVVVARPSFALDAAAVSLVPGTGQVASIVGEQWYLTGEGVTVNVLGAFAVAARAWLEPVEGAAALPEYAPFDNDGYVFADLPIGRSVAYLQLRDAQGVESKRYRLVLVRDATAPVVDSVRLNDDLEYSQSATVSLVVGAQDDYVGLSDLEMRLALCDAEAGAIAGCAVPLEDAPWREYRAVQSVTFPGEEGAKAIQLQVRDLNHNETAIVERFVEYDATPPADAAIELAGGEELIRTFSTTLTCSAVDARELRYGLSSGLDGQPWVPFRTELEIELPERDGAHTVFAQFRDAAGNVTGEVQDSVEVVTSGTLHGQVLLAGAEDHSGVEVALLGTGHAATSGPSGEWVIEGVRAGAYHVALQADGYEPQTLFNVVVRVAQTEDLGAIELAEIDLEPPQGMELRIGDGSGVIHTASPLVTILGDDAVEMRIGAIQGLARVPWQPILPQLRFDFSEEDGLKHLYARFRDAAGNETEELHAQAELDTKGTLVGRFLLPRRADHAGIRVELVGTGFVALTDAEGAWRMEDIPAGPYNLAASKDLFQTHTQGVTVLLGQETDLGEQILDDYLSEISGFVELEGLLQEHAFGGVQIEVVDHPEIPAYVTLETGRIMWRDVPPGHYPSGLRLSKPGFEPQEVRPLLLLPDDTHSIGTVRLFATARTITGTVRLSEREDHSGIEVTAVGETGTLVEGVVEVATTDAFGAFALELLPLGTYRVSSVYPAEPHRETHTVANVVLDPGPALVLPSVTLRERFVFIDDHAPVTRDPAVSLSLGASDCFQMRYGVEPDVSDGEWGDCAALVEGFALPALEPDSDPAGVQRTVYAQFRTHADPANPTDVVSDSIVLDDVVRIPRFEHDGGGRTLGMGGVLHVALDAGEPGRATFAIAGYDSDLQLYDDGTRGDSVAGDFVYERDFVATRVHDTVDAQVTGYFTDTIGNQGFEHAADTATIVVPPIVVGLTVETSHETASATIRWRTDEDSTGVVSWGETAQYGSVEAPTALGTEHSVTLEGLDPGIEYHYSVVATDAGANASPPTNDRTFRLVPAAPQAVVSIPGIGRNHLRWEAPSAVPLAGYHVYRRSSLDGEYTRLTDEPYNHEVYLYEDAPLENDGTTYYYAVSAVDLLGHEGALSEELRGAEPGPGLAEGESTRLSGAYTGVTVLSERESPYELYSSLSVEDNDDETGLLVVGPGIEVRARVGAGARIAVYGRLAVVGDPEDPTVFTSAADDGSEEPDNPASPGQWNTQGDWSGIHFEDASPPGELDLNEGRYLSGNLIYGARISYSDSSSVFYGGESAGTYALIASTVSRSINTDHVNDRLLYGGGLHIGSAKRVLVLRSSIEDNGPTTYGGGVHFTGDTILLKESILARNLVKARYPFGGAMTVMEGARVVRIVDCTVTDNTAFSDRVTSTGRTPGIAVYEAEQLEEMLLYGTVFSRQWSEGGDAVLHVSQYTPAAARFAVVNSVLVENEASRYGGLRWEKGPGAHAGAAVISSVFSGNVGHEYGLGVDVYGADEVYGSTFLGDDGEGSTWPRMIASTGAVRYSAFQGQASDGGGFVYPGGDPVTVIEGNSFLNDPDEGHGVLCMRSFDVDGAWDVPASGNYWGPVATSEMEAGGNPKNVSNIYDHYDNADVARILYDGWATSAFPMPRVTSPRWGYEYPVGASITLTGFGWDPEDTAGDCPEYSEVDPSKECPLYGPELCPAQCFLEEGSLEWRDGEGGDAAILGTGTEITTSFDSPGRKRVWLWAWDSNGQAGKVPTEVVILAK